MDDIQVCSKCKCCPCVCEELKQPITKDSWICEYKTAMLNWGHARDRIKELEAELHEARTDPLYWAKFNTVAGSSIECELERERMLTKELREENARLREQHNKDSLELGAALNMIQSLESSEDDEIARLRTEIKEWQQRAIGGGCKILSNPNCDCSLCIRDKKISELKAKNARLRAELEKRKLKWQTGRIPKDGWYFTRNKYRDWKIWYAVAGEEWTDQSEWTGPIEPPEEL